MSPLGVKSNEVIYSSRHDTERQFLEIALQEQNPLRDIPESVKD